MKRGSRTFLTSHTQTNDGFPLGRTVSVEDEPFALVADPRMKIAPSSA